MFGGDKEKPKGLAAVLMAAKPEEGEEENEMESSEESEGDYETMAKDLLDSLRSEDTGKIARVLKAFSDYCKE